MTSNLRPLFLFFTMLATLGAVGAESPHPRFVMTWAPPYAIEKCRAKLNADFGEASPRNTLTHLALQFWLPTSDGGLEKTAHYGSITDATVIEFRDWAKAHGIRTMLCIYNHNGSWDWPLAEAAFAQHHEAFVNALVEETRRLALDGVDVDFEGNGAFEGSKDGFIAFVRDLSTRLHALGKQITVDSFSHTSNAPNQNWWAELFPLVDGLNTMGYTYTGVNGPDWSSYASQKSVAGANAAKLLIGYPSSNLDWLGNSTEEHLQWIVDDPDVGIGIWDAQFSAPYWSTPAAWQVLAKMRKPH